MQERSHAFAMKIADLAARSAAQSADRIVKAVEDGLRAVGGVEHAGDAGGAHPRLPRPRPLHHQGQPAAGDARVRRGAGSTAPRHRAASCCRPRPSCTRRRRSRSAGRPPSKFIRRSASSTSSSAGDAGDVGIILQGGMYNGVIRALCSGSAWPTSAARRDVPLYVLNVTYPLIDDELVDFCRGKDAVLMVEEGQPDYHRAGAARRSCARPACRRRVVGKDMLPMAGEYTAPGDARRRRARSCAADAPQLLPADRPRAQRRRRLPTKAARRWPRWCRRGRRASAPAARSGRSSPP